jgi:transcriptional regulator with XRE-family HTH domain
MDTGLRREEVAVLAGVSVPYYTRLERGDLAGASDSVLDALARAPRLDDAERAHLFDLARAARPVAPPPRRRRRRQPALRRRPQPLRPRPQRPRRRAVDPQRDALSLLGSLAATTDAERASAAP